MSEQPLSLFTIGHSNHDWPTFLALLHQHQITALADVRSSPYSRMVPQFNRETLRAELLWEGIMYVDLGPELGARRVETECYDNGQVQFERVAKLPLFQQGLRRVCRGAERYRLTLMCAEKDPLTCHRMILVSRCLQDMGLTIVHIGEHGDLEPNSEAELRLLAEFDLPPRDLFRSRAECLDEAYLRQGERIAYVERNAENEVSE